jgi:hypothetical protein
LLPGKHRVRIVFSDISNISKQEEAMGHTRIYIISAAVAFLIALFSFGSWAADKVVVLEYNLKPVGYVESGKYLKTEWSAKLRNRISEPVSFDITIVFFDSSNSELKQDTTQGQLKAQETKTFSNTVLLDASLASKIASTRALIDETASETETAAP